MKKTLNCIICGNEDNFELSTLRLNKEEEIVGIIFCCKECKPEYIKRFKSFAAFAKIGTQYILSEEIDPADYDMALERHY